MKELTLQGYILVSPLSGLHNSIAALFDGLPQQGNIISLRTILKEDKRNDGLLYHLSEDAMVEMSIQGAVVDSKVVRDYKWKYTGKTDLRSKPTRGVS